MRRVALPFLLGTILFMGTACRQEMAHNPEFEDRVATAWNRVGHELQSSLSYCNLPFGGELYLVAYKEERQMEVWGLSFDKHWMLWKTFPICAASGEPGPKEREGDKQVPEGYYRIRRSGMNPRSKYHLSMDIGYPNKEDRTLGRTGSLIMIHGGCDSVGCLAIGDKNVEPLYLMVNETLKRGYDMVPVSIFPFRMTEPLCAAHAGPQWHPTWDDLRKHYDEVQILFRSGKSKQAVRGYSNRQQ